MLEFMRAGTHGRRELTRHECMARLRETRWGRLAYTDHALPAITPVPYELVREAIVFPREWLPAAAHPDRDAVVAFEIDGPGEARGPGWCVVVVGWASAFTEPGATDDVSYSKVTPTFVVGHDYLPQSSWERSR